MSEEKVLTKEIAEQFLADEDSVDLSEFTAIEDDAAELLGSYGGDELNLDGLEQIGIAAVRRLVKFGGSDLSLGGLRQISTPAAKVLATAIVRGLTLGLESLSAEVFRHLATWSPRLWSSLALDNISSLSKQAAMILEDLQVSELHLNGLTQLPIEGWQALNKNLKSCKEFSLCQLKMASVTTLTEPLARIMVERGTSHNNSRFTTITADAARYFKEQGWFPCPEVSGGALNGIKSISDEVAKILGQAEFDICLNGISEISDKQMELLCNSNRRYELRLDGLVSLSDRAVDALTRKRANRKNSVAITNISLRGLTELTEYAAAKLHAYLTLDDGAPTYMSTTLKVQPAIRKGIRNRKPVSASLKTDSNPTILSLVAADFFEYRDLKPPELKTLRYPASGLGAYFQMETEKGQTIDVHRIVGADVEELLIWGLSYVINESLHYLGIDTSVVSEEKDEDKLTWICNESRYPILGEGIDDSRYARAAYAIVAILNQLLESSGSKDRAYGVGEGNGFGVAFLNNSLRKIIQREADEEQKPISESQLRKEAKSACGANEPPICIEIPALRTSAELDAQAVRQLQTSLRSKTPESVSRVVGTLEAVSATLDQINDVFTPKVISILVNTWDIELWSAMTPVLYLSQSVKEQFTSLVRTRVGKKIPEVYTYRKKGSRFLEEFYSRATDKLVALGHELLPDVPLQLGLEQLSDVAAESLARHTQSLYLHGLLDLPDTVALALTNHSGPWLSLRGVTTLSEAAAERLSRYQGHLVLDGVKSLSDDAAQQLANHKHKLDLPMRHANNVFKQARNLHEVSELLLTKSEIQKLLRAKSEDTVKQCLKETAALQLTVADRIEIMTSPVLSRLVNSWDVLVWSELVPLIQPVPLLLREFTELARLRLKQKLPRFHPLYSTELRNQATVFVEEFFARGTAVLLELSEYIIPSEPPVYLDQLKGISKATAHQLAKHPNLELKLGNFSKPVAKILRDARDGE